jgi:hypothetical protein
MMTEKTTFFEKKTKKNFFSGSGRLFARKFPVLTAPLPQIPAFKSLYCTVQRNLPQSQRSRKSRKRKGQEENDGIPESF